MRQQTPPGSKIQFPSSNPSPWRDDFPWGSVRIATLVVKETEVARVFRMQPGRLAKGMVAIRRRLACLGVEEVVITRGGESTLCLTSASALEAPVLPVEPIDTVGAGDTFAGTLAVRLAEGESLECAGGPPTAPAPWPRSAAIPSRSATDRMLARLPATPRL